MPKDLWERLIQRAEQLVAESSSARELLSFYVKVLQAQRDIYENLRACQGWLPSGNLQEDLPVVRPMISPLLRAVEKNGPAPLVAEAQNFLRATESEIDQALIEQWRNPSDSRFFEKAFLQPYARWLADSGGRPVDRYLESRENRCPLCSGKPQVSLLQSRADSSESGGRDLQCSTCLTTWPFRRVVCTNCGEERPEKLGYFHSEQYDHSRVEACDSCRYYMKGIDLTRFGFAVPLVDEVAAAALDLWAREHGYEKIELNLLGI